MNTNQMNTISLKERCSSLGSIYALTTIVLSIGFILAIVSWLRICSEACSEGHNYRLYGFTFESIGIPFFGALTLAQLSTPKIPQMNNFVFVALSVGVGAEFMFIYAQKYIIGHWCPICLCVAASVIVAFLLTMYNFVNNAINTLDQRQRRGKMKNFFKFTLSLALVAFGFLFSQAGLAKFDQLQAAEKSIKESIAFGDQSSHVEVYVFTDWECPACRKIESVLERAGPEIMKKAALVYVDMAVHPESTNFTPYNLSFMIKDKPQYFKLREMLTQLSERTTTPSDELVEDGAKKLGVKYEQLHYSDIDMGIKYFQHLAKQFGVDRTPTVVIVNKEKKKGKKLIGGVEITQENILNAIESLSK